MADSLTNKITLGDLQRALSRLWGYITDRLASKASVDAALAGKQDTISDIDTIRSGAAKGETSLQSTNIATSSEIESMTTFLVSSWNSGGANN